MVEQDESDLQFEIHVVMMSCPNKVLKLHSFCMGDVASNSQVFALCAVSQNLCPQVLDYLMAVHFSRIQN